jgi:membrane fusion protein, heavy metal efflux system
MNDIRTLKRNITASIIALFFISSCGSRNKEVEKVHEVLPPGTIELNASQFKSAGIILGNVEFRRIRNILKVNGVVNVTPQNIAFVSTPLGGFVKSTNLVQGSPVKKGQTMALIENMEFIQLQQDFLEAKAKYHYAEVEYKRHSELFKDNVYSENNVQQTETEYKTMKAHFRALEQKLLLLGLDPEKLTEEKISGILPVTAPINGYLRSVNINIGKYVSPTDVLFEIVNPENVVLELMVFEKDVRKVTTGQKVTFTTPNDPGNVYSASVYQAGRALDKDKMSTIFATIEQNNGGLLSGMYVNAEIETGDLSVTAVPENAVVQFNEKFYIFIHKGKRNENGKKIDDFEAVEVIKGNTDKGFTGIRVPGGIDISKVQVVTSGAYSILSAWKNAGEMAC